MNYSGANKSSFKSIGLNAFYLSVSIEDPFLDKPLKICMISLISLFRTSFDERNSFNICFKFYYKFPLKVFEKSKVELYNNSS